MSNTQRAGRWRITAWLTGLAAAASMFSTGCQFFFPMPLEPDVETDAPTQAVRTTGAPFDEGEVLEAKVFVEDVAAGSVTLRVGKKCLADGKLALPITGEGQVGGLLSFLGTGSADTSALIDVDASMPLEAKWDLEVDDKRTFVELDYATGRYRVHQRREVPNKKPANSYKRVELQTEQTPHDGHSLLGYLRRWDQPEGTRGFLYVVLGRTLLRTDVTLTGRERIKTSLGEREAVRIDGVATRVLEKTLQPSTRHTPKPFTLWLADDADRVPLRIVVTTDLAELTIDLAKHSKVAVPAGKPTDCSDRVDKRALAKARGPRKRDKNRTVKPIRRIAPGAEPPGGPDLDVKRPRVRKPEEQPVEATPEPSPP